MATFQRTSPTQLSIEDGQVAGELLLTGGDPLPGDFNPNGVTAVLFSYEFVLTGQVDDVWTENRNFGLTAGGVTIRSVNQGGVVRGNGTFPTSSGTGAPTGTSQDWSDLRLRSFAIPTAWNTWSRSKGADNATGTVRNGALTVTYSPLVLEDAEIWNGSAWVGGEAWNGSSWVQPEVWNGTRWVPVKAPV